MPKVFSAGFSVPVLMAAVICAGVNPSQAQVQDRRIQDVMRCQRVEERFILGRDLGLIVFH